MKVTVMQLMVVEKCLTDLYNQAKKSGANNLIELKTNDSIKIGYLPYTIEEAKEYLAKRFYNHPSLKSKIIDDMFAFALNALPQNEFSEKEHNQITGIKIIVERKGYLEGLKYVNAAVIELNSSVKLHLLKAEILSKLDRNDEAIQVYNQILDMNPINKYEIYAMRGASYATLNMIKEAEQDYSAALKLNNRLPIVLCNRGAMFIKQKKYKQALEDFNQAISLEPDESRGYFSRGTLFLKYMDKTDEGLNDLLKAAELGHPQALDAFLS